MLEALDPPHITDKVFPAEAIDFAPFLIRQVHYSIYRNHILFSEFEGLYPLILFEKTDGTIKQV